MSKFKNLISFFKSVGREMGKVSWISKKELFNKTFTVISFIVLMTLFFAASDYLISTVKNFIFN